MKNGGSITWKLRPDAVHNRLERQLVAAAAGHHAHVPARRHERLAEPTQRKQTGRRYGPAPRREPHPGMQAPAPMGAARRAALYCLTLVAYFGNGVWVAAPADDPKAVAHGGTARQRRQWTRMRDRQLWGAR